MFAEYILVGQSQSELNTEIRFITASATVDKKSVIRLKFADKAWYVKMEAPLLKVLRTLKKEGIIEFFVTKDGFISETTESIYLSNKYGDFLDDSDTVSVYVKL